MSKPSIDEYLRSIMPAEAQAEIEKLIAACRAAELCLQSIERNERSIEEGLRKTDAGIATAFTSTVGGWKRNLEHARKIIKGLPK